MLRVRRKTIFTSALILGLVVWIVGGSLWYTRLYMNKERRFWAAISNGLQTRSVTKEITDDTPNGETVQLSRMSFGANPYAEGKNLVRNRTSTITESTVVTRTLATQRGSFVKYDQIETNEKKPDGSNFDFSEVVNVWASQGGGIDQSGNVEKLAENFIQLVPFANLDPGSAKEFTSRLRSTGVYAVNYDLAEEDSENNLTVYDVTLSAKPYVIILNDIFKKAGYGDIGALDSSQYDDTSTVKIKVAIDGSNRVSKIQFAESGGFESYRDYGAIVKPSEPENPVSFTELQTRLQTSR